MKKESHNTEFKQSWRDEFLRTICAFANTHGGVLFVGKDDTGSVVGVQDAKKLLEDIPNKIINSMGIIPDVSLKREKTKEYISVKVKPNKHPVSYKGKYYIRSGSTTQELNGTQLQKFLLEKSGLSWEEIIEDRASLKDIDTDAINHFKELASERFPQASKEKSVSHLLEKLDLFKKGKLTRAAILLFGKDPQKYYSNSIIRIGRFKDEATLLGEDEISGNLFHQVEETVEVLKKKYLNADVKIEGLYRTENLEYPEQALREAIVNAVVHRDYLTNDIQIKVYPNQLSFWNNGGLTDGLTIEKLKKKHSSHRRNKLIADVFHKAGFIEKWGSGTVNMIKECKDMGLPEPVYEETEGGMQVTFLKDSYTEERLSKMGLNERQIKAVLYVKEYGKITNKKYMEIGGISERTATRDLSDLVIRKMLMQVGTTGKGTEYLISRHKAAKAATKPPQREQGTLEKKLSLLERKLEGIDENETVKIEFGKEVFFKIYDSWLSELMRKLIPVGQQFNRFFREAHHHVFVISGIGQVKFKNEDVEEVIRKLKVDCQKKKDNIVGKAEFECSFYYNKLVKGGLQPFSIRHSVKIEFDDIKYKVFTDELHEGTLRNHVQQFNERLLHKPMTEKEMSDLADKMGEIFYEEIEQYRKKYKIGENEKN